MSTPPKPRFEPVAALAMPDGTELHTSMRTSLSTNTEPSGQQALRICTSRLSMKVEGGVLKVRFSRDRVGSGSQRRCASPLRKRLGR